MMSLIRLSLVQYYLYDQEDIDLSGHTALLGPNGCGKSSTLDAIQIVMMGAHGSWIHFNAQSVSEKQNRSVRDYCLGVLRQHGDGNGKVLRARDDALSYLILVFSNPDGSACLTAGLCIAASAGIDKHEVMGMFILPGQALTSNDCVTVLDATTRTSRPWDEFISERQSVARTLGQPALTPSQSTAFVQELLYHLGGKDRMPNPTRFMKALVKAMTLKNVDSIDQFVRNHVVEPNPVNVATFGRQIRQFRELQAMIAALKARIARLHAVAAEYTKVRRASARLHTLRAIQATLAYEAVVERLNAILADIERDTDEQEAIEQRAAAADAELRQLRNEIDDLRSALAHDPVEQRRRTLTQDRLHSQQLLAAIEAPLLGRLRAVRTVLSDKRWLLEKLQLTQLASEVEAALAPVFTGQDARMAMSRHDAIMHLDEALTRMRTGVQLARDGLRDAQVRDEAALQALEGRVSAWTHSKARVDDGTGRLIRALEYKDITARPLSALVEVVDPTWQSAIEAYLGARRDALFVAPERTREAVAVLRELHRLPGGAQGASIVQAEHLRNARVQRGERLVIDQLRCTDPVAQEYLSYVLGDMRCVETEEELERFPRALTVDGLLSQGAVTRTLPKVSQGDFRLGKQARLDVESTRREVVELQNRIAAAKAAVAASDTVLAVVATPVAPDTAHGDIDVTQDHVESLRKIDEELAALDANGESRLKAALVAAEKAEREMDSARITLAADGGSVAARLLKSAEHRGELEAEMTHAVDDEQAARAHADVDMSMYAQLKERLERDHPEPGKALIEATRLGGLADNTLMTATQGARDACLAYVREEEIDAQVEAMNWQEAAAWTQAEITRLTDIQLVERERQAAEVREASEKTFRQDVAISLHDRFVEIERHRKEFNRILADSPPFTGGERYEFAYIVLPDKKPLYNLIRQIARDDEGMAELLGEDLQKAQQEINQLIEAAADPENGPKAPDALLDFRAFFSFDLNILVDGKQVDCMSSRQGAGSNGEHIAPMYVAAGASLAKAYRMPTRTEDRTCTGIMLMDEAFHGMDTQNAMATARFLQGLGLQLIMAGPELEKSKLIPITDIIYDLDRDGLDLDLQFTRYTPAAHALMISDMPSENPQVFLDAMAVVNQRDATSAAPRTIEVDAR